MIKYRKITDIPLVIENSVAIDRTGSKSWMKFADDTKVFGKVMDEKDRVCCKQI